MQTPARVFAPTEGRNSIVYGNLPPVQDTTKIFFIDNKAADIDAYNQQKDHSNYFTNIIQTQNLNAEDSSVRQIIMDERSRWGGDLHTITKTCAVNCCDFFQSNSCKVKLMVDKNKELYEWFDLVIPEGNYVLNEVIDLLNESIVQIYLANGRQNGVLESDIGVKFDSRYMFLGRDPVTSLVTPGAYVYKGYHADIFLLPNCAVDFSKSRLSNILGIRKRDSYTDGFILTYEDLQSGNIPALLDIKKFQQNGEISPVLQDSSNRSYHVTGEPGNYETLYRSFLCAYLNNQSTAFKNYLLVNSDISAGIGQLYWSLPDIFKPPVTFKMEQKVEMSPVVGTQLFPLIGKSVYSGASVYNQMIESATNSVHVFNRFPDNQILMQAPCMNTHLVSENVPLSTNQGTLPIHTVIPGVQRVILTDDQRRPCPYVVKSIATVQPKVISPATLQ
ncbi:III [Frog adenovirus 1]|uniref:III n=1 Tax=Frog adenovirus 1 (strain ATCC VR-896) TaxID=114102 RepID=Q9IIH9_ADEF1|nr:III [Frog adenovirus 1]AAF86928.1 III [Frog adenovirus 1]